ncbi:MULTISPECIES: DeoR/GlpR family DNA-binding transcription regulator [unclassified Romboutsia]|uniref:DeoR/GlpR family DNA-binding transcription regulator n=1 Tax=unclassified Romboutsia TaxID=2626894 RepID=UPI00082136C9|nr:MULTISPECIES: DeoR/GlpR family DNA-binding transcription regulator [unclassified Romboutsia]SCH50188.1 Glycerol-3-phosphate regulon repressor [uncultured Clostridium sp.]
MLMLQRHIQIINLLNKNIRMTTNDFCKELNVSAGTIRNDLNFLEKEKLLKKFHGGAAILEKHYTIDIDKRNKQNNFEKEIIANEALKLIQDDQCIILDASSTALALAKKLVKFKRLTVITNGIYTMMALKDLPNITVIFIGGIVTKNSACTEGLLGCDLLDKINADISFVSSHGFTLDEGLTDFNLYEVELKKQMLKRSKKCIALLDYTKFENISTASFGNSCDIDLIITDSNTDISIIEKYRNSEVKVIIAK